jgi:hypothetical protein
MTQDSKVLAAFPGEFGSEAEAVRPATQNDNNENLAAYVEQLSTRVNEMNLQISTVTDVQSIADAVVARIFDGGNFGSLPNDMGLPAEFQLGRAAQNFYIWSARRGVEWAFQQPETLLYIATILDAMAQGGSNTQRVENGLAALAAVKKTLGK